MKARAIALYLPQFHPNKINDKYWGKGFTEWTNVAKAKPLFWGHYEPRIPADLGFYDLRLEEVREEQAKLAHEAGIEGFCYWHYWFGDGKEILEKPLDEVQRTGRPEFPFCIGWANHSWTTKTWQKSHSCYKDEFIFQQKYLGENDNEKHFYRLLNIFKDKRYITVDGKLLFLIYDIYSFVNFSEFKKQWNELAIKNGLNGFYFVAYVNTLPKLNIEKLWKMPKLEKIVDEEINNVLSIGVDAVNTVNLKYAELKTRGILYKAIVGGLRKQKLNLILEKYDYKNIVKNYYTDADYRENVFPQILVGNDRSPRAGRNAIIYYNANPQNFYNGVMKALKYVKDKEEEHKIIFINSWNEWGEGAYLEPDLRYGKQFIKMLREALNE